MEDLVQVPNAVVNGKAQIKLSFDAWKDGRVAPKVLTVPVYVPEAVEAPQLRRTVRGLPEDLHAVSIAPDGKTVALASPGSKSVQVWDVGQGQEIRRLPEGPGQVFGTAFLPDSKAVAVSYSNRDRNAPSGGVIIWDIATGGQRTVLRRPTPRACAGLYLSADGRFLAVYEVAADKAALSVWEVATGKVTLEFEDAAAVAFSPDTPVLALAVHRFKDHRYTGLEVLRHDLTRGQTFPPLSVSDIQRYATRLAFAPDGRTLAGADFRGGLILWDAASRKALQACHEEAREVLALAWSPNGKVVAAGLGNPPGRKYEPGMIVLWDGTTAKPLETLTGHTSEVIAVAFTPDGRTLLSVGRDRSLRVWDVGDRAARSK